MRNLDCDNFLGMPSTPSNRAGLPYHLPVMAAQVKSYLRPTPGMLLLDGTAGGGGHTHLMLEAGAEVISLDQDPQALAECLKRLAHFGTKSRLVESISAKPLPLCCKSEKSAY